MGSCQDCKYADYYPAYWWYPHLEPYCQKGHGLCRIDRICSDYEKIGRDSR